MTGGRSSDRRRLALTLLILTLAVLLFGCDGKGKRQLDLLKQFAAETPRYKDFAQVSSFEQHSADSALLVLCYESSANLDDVVAFYSRTLGNRSWVVFPAEERKRTILYGDDLAFRKGDYLIGIKKAREPYKGCQYLITYYWKGF